LILQHNDFEQIDRLLLMIENGNVLDENGYMVMQSVDKEIYQVAPALNAWCDYWQDIAKMKGFEINDHALRALINKINYEMKITKSLVNEAKEIVEQQRKLFMTTSHNVISSTAITHQIALRMEDSAKA
jgi:hypothetical protein